MRSELSFFNSKQNLITDNINIRKVNQKEIMFIQQLAPRILDKFAPIIIDQKVFFISKETDIVNKAVFAAVMNGNYIRENSMKNIENEKIIDIK